MELTFRQCFLHLYIVGSCEKLAALDSKCVHDFCRQPVPLKRVFDSNIANFRSVLVSIDWKICVSELLSSVAGSVCLYCANGDNLFSLALSNYGD